MNEIWKEHGHLIFLFGILAFFYWIYSILSKIESQELEENIENKAKERNLEYLKFPNHITLSNIEKFDIIKMPRKLPIPILFTTNRDKISINIFPLGRRIGYGIGTTSIWQTAVYMRFDSINIPNFILKPESLLNKFKNLILNTSIKVTDRPSFYAEYIVQGKDVDGIRALFKKPVIDYFTNHDRYCIEKIDNELMIFRYNELYNIEKYEDLLDKVFLIINLFKKPNNTLKTWN